MDIIHQREIEIESIQPELEQEEKIRKAGVIITGVAISLLVITVQDQQSPSHLPPDNNDNKENGCSWIPYASITCSFAMGLVAVYGQWRSWSQAEKPAQFRSALLDEIRLIRAGRVGNTPEEQFNT